MIQGKLGCNNAVTQPAPAYPPHGELVDMHPISIVLESELNPKVDEQAYRTAHCLN